jgi:hypothetical protein
MMYYVRYDGNGPLYYRADHAQGAIRFYDEATRSWVASLFSDDFTQLPMQPLWVQVGDVFSMDSVLLRVTELYMDVDSILCAALVWVVGRRIIDRVPLRELAKHRQVFL